VHRAGQLAASLLCVFAGLHNGRAIASPECPAEQSVPLEPTDKTLCADLETVIRQPRSIPIAQYEEKLGQYLRHFCHRNPAAGWRSDKMLRDTGPYIATLSDGTWTGKYYGTHAPVVIWYSPEMIGWLHANRPSLPAEAPAHPAPVPDGAIMVKEMFPAPAEACLGIDPGRLLPTSGAAVMVRDSEGSHDGWFWGWFGWSGWAPDWPAPKGNPYPNMGFGQYCTNCHASAHDNSTFASLNNIAGEPGNPIQYLSQYGFVHAQLGEPTAVNIESPLHELIGNPPADTSSSIPVEPLPSQTYDSVWVAAHAGVASEYVTSDQCLGCHSSGGTGLQFHMTVPGPDNRLIDLSPYGTWRASPMGMAGRDPIFLAQLASETQTFHPKASAEVQDTCLGCHGLMGQRQFAVDRKTATGHCEPFERSMIDATPWPFDNPVAALAKYGALARDGISCVGCHHMVFGKQADERYGSAPQNSCVLERQALLNPDEAGLARTFTGSFLVGPPGEAYGPFENPKVKPMEAALGMEPVASQSMLSSELCASCHTVHLKVLNGAQSLGHVYEQATYPEWAFSDYRTGSSLDGPLPFGAGARAESCQGCHMSSRNPDGSASATKIANIQEYSTFPQVEHGLGAADIDLQTRSGFARHTLVGLNIFFAKMMQEYPDALGVRTTDPMLVSRGVASIDTTVNAMLQQAAETTAKIAVERVSQDDSAFAATVVVENLAGHKFPSGVGFRRAFLTFRVFDAEGTEIWASGRTDHRGAIVDETGAPIAGEYWWKPDCSALLTPDSLAYQPHYQTITRQDQAQIFQELVTAPPAAGTPTCHREDPPQGPLTTSFLSICSVVKDNRLLPHGFLDREKRLAIGAALGAGPDLADEVVPVGVGDDPSYRRGGGDRTTYRISKTDLKVTPAFVEATLYYQAIPPFYLQDRACTSHGADTDRLAWLTKNVDLTGTPAEDWKLRVVSTGKVAVIP